MWFGSLSPDTVEALPFFFPILPSSSIRNVAARLNRVRTLDGGVVLSHRGFSHGDRTMTIETRLSTAERKRLVSMLDAETSWTLACPEGLFRCAVAEISGDDPARLSILVAEKYPEWEPGAPATWVDRTLAWASDYGSTGWLDYMDPPGWGCYCGLGSNWHRIIPAGGWETGGRPSTIDVAFRDMAGEFRLLDTGGATIASVIGSGVSEGQYPITFGGADIGALEFRQFDGDGDSYSLLSRIRFR